jgi:hypothetical protein
MGYKFSIGRPLSDVCIQSNLPNSGTTCAFSAIKKYNSHLFYENVRSGQTAVLLFLRHNIATLYEASKTSGYIADSEYVNLYKKVLVSLL